MDLTDPREVWAHRNEVQILDLRESFDFCDSAIEGSVNVTVGNLLGGLVELDPSLPVVLVCRSGDQSEIAALMLQVRGLDAHHVDGGLEAWEKAGVPFSSSSPSRDRAGGAA